MSGYGSSTLGFFGGNRQIGFNRHTWQMGNRVGRAVRPYLGQIGRYSQDTLGSIRSRLSSRINSQRSARSSKSAQNRSLRGNRGTPVGKQIPSGGGESKSYTTVKNPKLPMGVSKKLLGVNTVNRNGAGTVSTVSGSQAIQLVGEYFNVLDVQNAFSGVSQTTTGYNSGKLAFENIHSTHLYTNSCDRNTHMTIYDCVARFDGSDLNTSPTAVIAAGGADATGGALSDFGIPGTTPYNNPRFTSAYKIVKQTPIILSPGQTHVHRVNYGLNKVVSKERIVTSDLAGPLGNITMYTFIIIHGTPSHETAAETTVSLSLAKIDYVYLESFTYRCMLVNSDYNSITNSLPVLAAGEQWTTNVPTDTVDAS